MNLSDLGVPTPQHHGLIFFLSGFACLHLGETMHNVISTI
ncbi:hypothetical protein AVEN_213601-1, partial [Araneus ventricosus]